MHTVDELANVTVSVGVITAGVVGARPAASVEQVEQQGRIVRTRHGPCPKAASNGHTARAMVHG